MKSEVKAGNNSMMAETVPVNIIFNQMYEGFEDFADGVIGFRFQVLEIDGIYLVTEDEVIRGEAPKTQMKAFLEKSDAFAYLELLGVDVPL